MSDLEELEREAMAAGERAVDRMIAAGAVPFQNGQITFTRDTLAVFVGQIIAETQKASIELATQVMRGDG